MAQASVTMRPAGWDDLLDLPEGFKGEIVDGELLMSPRPAPPHLEAASRLGALLVTGFDLGVSGPGGWVILFEPYVGFGADIRIPDIAGWRRERYRTPDAGPYAIAPDWIAEVLSPSTVRMDRDDKMELYLAHGVGHVWLVDPVARTLEVFRGAGKSWLRVKVFTKPEPVRAEPFDAVELNLGLIWPAAGSDDPAPHA